MEKVRVRLWRKDCEGEDWGYIGEAEVTWKELEKLERKFDIEWVGVKEA